MKKFSLIAVLLAIVTISVFIGLDQQPSSVNSSQDSNSVSQPQQSILEVISANSESMPDSFIENASINLFNNQGALTHKLDSQWIQIFNNQQLTDFIKPRLLVLDENGEHWYSNSLKGELNTSNGQLDLQGSVQMWQNYGSQQRRFETEKLRFNTKHLTAQTDQPITFTQPQHSVTGIGMTADLNEGSYRILSNVKSQHYVD